MKLKKQQVKVDQEEINPVPPQAEIIEADLYKRTYFGPDVQTLDLECWEEELSEVQLQKYKNADEEYKSIQNKLDEMVKETGGEIVYNGDQFTAYQLLGKQPVLKDLERQSADIIRSRSRSLSVSKEAKSKRGRHRKHREEDDRDYTPALSPEPLLEARHKKKKKEKEKEKEKDKDKVKEKEKDKDSTKTKDKTLTPSNVHSVVTNVRPSESSAIGGLLTGSATKATAVVDLTKDDGNNSTANKNVADSREVSFNKLQGKTFPSLVVVARPYLRNKDAPPPLDRSTLDSKVKAVLMHTPTKFTEWLIQQGLIRSEQWCAIHPDTKLKLGMYSDETKFPYSGGYVWISECCPTRFVSVFCSSIFEAATFPPSVLLKLIYHWACQTNVQNVVQWVKVDNLYVKGLFTWLRAICTSAIHEHMGLLGGTGKKVEVGVISLGTTSHDGTQRQVKVEVLGVLDTADKLIRLRAVEPLAEQEKNYKKRFQKILEPLSAWVNPNSIIVTDLTVDIGTLLSMGFKNVQQSSSHTETPGRSSNANIMEYLRRIVPRMFQNTLSLLSRQIIQQFLDELVWREKYGISPGLAFDNIVTHIAEQTKLDAKDNITVRLSKIAANPFKNWKYPKIKTRDEADTTEPETRSKRTRRRKELTPPPPPPSKRRRKEKNYVIDDVDEVESTPKSSAAAPESAVGETRSKRNKKRTSYVIDDDDEEMPLAHRFTKIKQEREKEKSKETPPPKEISSTPSTRGRPRKRKTSYVEDEMDDIPLKAIKKEPKQEETVSMEKYYFGQFGGDEEPVLKAIAVECPECHLDFNNNCDLLRHLFFHVVSFSGEGSGHQCIYCLHKFGTEDELTSHLKQEHPSDTKSPNLYTYACLICEVRFAAVLTLATHMQKTHVPLELPYTCGICSYRGSSHRLLIEHFHAKHTNDHRLLCPYCLMVISVYAEGQELTCNLKMFMDHLKLHQDKEMELKCNRCVLRFVHLGQLKDHQMRDHKTVENAKALCSQEHLITKPKNKARPPVKDSACHAMSETYENVSLVLRDGFVCRECDAPLDNEKHFLGVSKCSKCSYTTSCHRAQLQHSGYCAGPHSLEDAPRPAPLTTYCVCGYSTPIGTDMLTHLLICEHKTAYSRMEDVESNKVREEPPATAPAGSVPAAASDTPESVEQQQSEPVATEPVVASDLVATEPTDTTTPAEQISETSGTSESTNIVPPADYAPPSVLNTQLSLDDLAPPSVLSDQQYQDQLLKDTYDRPLATPRHEETTYSLGDFEPLPQEPPPQPDFEQL